MSAPLSPIGTGNCISSCVDQAISQIPGPDGSSGASGTNGTNGQNAYTLTTASFVAPAIAGAVVVTVQNSDWISNGQDVYVTVAGYYKVIALTNSTHVTIQNYGYSGNAAPGTNIPAPQKITPSGLKGTDGAAGSTTFNQISPTTNKADLIVDNGALSPNASDVRLAVGTNGKALVADSTQPTGLGYATITPNAVTDKGVPRFSGATGTPVPLGPSLLVIDDAGSINSTPTGGNARGTKAVDLQVERTVATQVASGLSSGILSGKNNTASASFAVVAGGSTNVASGISSFVAGAGNIASGLDSCVPGGTGTVASGASAIAAGDTNTASGATSSSLGGTHNVASGDNSAVVGGNNNVASGDHASIIGSQDALADKYGQEAHAAGQFGARGDAQRSRLISRNNTVDATSTPLYLDGASLVLSVPINTAWAFTGMVIGRTSAGVNGFYQVSGGIKNNGGVTSLIGAVTVAAVVADGGWPGGASVTITADVINNALKIACVCAAATLCRWVGNLDITEVSY